MTTNKPTVNDGYDEWEREELNKERVRDEFRTQSIPDLLVTYYRLKGLLDKGDSALLSLLREVILEKNAEAIDE